MIKKKYSSYWINKLETNEHWLLCRHQIKSSEIYIKLKYTLSEIRVNYGFTLSYQISNYINIFSLDIDEKKSTDAISYETRFIPYKSYVHFCFFEVF